MSKVESEKKAGGMRATRWVGVCAGTVVGLSAVFATAQSVSVDHVLTLSDAVGHPGDSVWLYSYLDSYSENLAGWAYGVCHDSSQVLITSVLSGATTQTVKNGSPPDFNQILLYGDGWTIGVVVCFIGCATLQPGSGYELNQALYQIAGAPGDVAAVEYCTTLGVPPVTTVVVASGQSLVPLQYPGFVIALADVFIRADANGDGLINVADVIFVAEHVVGSGQIPPCRSAADCNDDDSLDLADPVYLALYLFNGGAAPPAPFVACGTDASLSLLDCATLSPVCGSL